MRFVKNLFALFSLVFFAIGCGQDRNAEDYRNSQVELELSKYRSIQGIYRGLAYQAGSQKPFATVEVQLFASSTVDTDGIRTEPRPVLQSYVTLKIPNMNEITVSMNTGYYVPQENQLKTTTNATRAGLSRTIQLDGKVRGQRIEGLLSVFGYPGTALEIDVERSAPLPALEPEDFAKDRLRYVNSRGKIIYEGKAFYAGGKVTKATLELNNNTVNATEMLVDILSPVRVFTGMIDMDQSTLRFTFANMAWDNEAGTLNGSQERGGIENVVIRVECTDFISAKTEGWDCTYTSSMGGILREFEFRRSRD
jgi:hypothetical protein